MALGLGAIAQHRSVGLDRLLDFGAYLRHADVTAQGDVVGWGDAVGLPTLDAGIEALGWRWRKHLAQRFERDETGLLLGIFAGDKKAVSREIKEAFQKLGLAHLLAVSGYHVGLVAGLFLVLLRAQNRWFKRCSVVGVWCPWVLSMPVARLFLDSDLGSCCPWCGPCWCAASGPRHGKRLGGRGAGVCVGCVSSEAIGHAIEFLATASLLALAHEPRVAWRVPWRAQWATSF